MASMIGLTIDIIAFLFAMAVLPVCTIAFWLTYDDPTIEDFQQKENTEDKNMKGAKIS